MPEREPSEVKNRDIYGHAALPCSRARDEHVKQPDPKNPVGHRSTFLSTTRPNGDTHTAPVGAMWHDGDLSFTSGPGNRKSRNLARHPRGTIAVRLKGLDLVLEGDVSRVSDAATL